MIFPIKKLFFICLTLKELYYGTYFHPEKNVVIRNFAANQKPLFKAFFPYRNWEIFHFTWPIIIFFIKGGGSRLDIGEREEADVQMWLAGSDSYQVFI